MKEASWNAFKESGCASYSEYINGVVKDIKIEYNISNELDINALEIVHSENLN